MGKEIERTAVRNEILETIRKFMETNYETDVMYVAGGELTMPVVDEHGNEFYANVVIKIPRGSRENGTYMPYNGYEEAKAYKDTVEAKALEKEIKRKNKEHEAAEKKRKQEAKKIVKKLNKEGLDAMIHEGE